MIDRPTYLDALVAGRAALREMYLRVRSGSPSPTRRNIERVVALLAEQRVGPVLQTNVWSVPTRDLATLRHADGSPPVVTLPSLSPPAANGWLPGSWDSLEELAASLAA